MNIHCYKITDIDIEEETKTLNILSLIGKLRYIIDCTRIDAMATLRIESERHKNAFSPSNNKSRPHKESFVGLCHGHG